MHRGREVLREGLQHPRRHVHQHHARGRGIDAAEVGLERGAHHLRDRAGHLDPGRPSPDQHEGEQLRVLAGILLGLGQLERVQDAVAHLERVGRGLESRRERRERVVPEVAEAGPDRQHQVVVGERGLVVVVAHAQTLACDVHPRDLGQDHRGVLLFAQNAA